MESTKVRFKALSVVAPAGDRIATKKKSIEIRSWVPEEAPLLNVAIVQNENYLLESGEEDKNAYVVAIVDFIKVEPWTEKQQKEACSKEWSFGYFGWHITNVRKLAKPIKTIAKRKIYEIELSDHKI